MSIPAEFSREAVAAASEGVQAPYREFVKSGEPYRSLLRANPWMAPPKRGETSGVGRGPLLRHHRGA